MNTMKIAVVGAGIAGVTTAYGLARRGATVTLIDDAASGQATAASAGIIAPWVSSSTGAFYEAYSAGGNYYPEFLARLRSEEHTSELQSRGHLVCRLLLEQ